MFKPIVLKVNKVHSITGEAIDSKKISLSFGEAEAILKCVRSQVDWGAGSCYGDGEDIIEKEGYKNAKAVFNKLWKVLG